MPDTTGNQFLDLLQKLNDSGLVKGNMPVIVFGTTPGVVTDVTVGAGGCLTFLYRDLKPEEMGSKPAGPQLVPKK